MWLFRIVHNGGAGHFGERGSCAQTRRTKEPSVLPLDNVLRQRLRMAEMPKKTGNWPKTWDD
jgi:hypothetical protein